MRTNGVTINDAALIHLPRNKRNKCSHSIIAEAEETFAEVHIPMELDGQTMSCFITRKPTQQEIDNVDHSCIHVHMTPSSRWEPGDQTIGDNEATLQAYITNETESSSRGQKLHAMATKEDEFSISRHSLHRHGSTKARNVYQAFCSPSFQLHVVELKTKQVRTIQTRTGKRCLLFCLSFLSLGLCLAVP